ncbi:MAG: hybrid sensor histidine kinase/response regulator [Bacteroidales bacterium]|jgi:signal transduction histidine kinase
MKELKRIQTEKEANQYSILIVDDVAMNIQLAAKFLTNEGYNLYFAQDGKAALKQVENRLFDLILLDIMMPGMDGFEVCKRMKERDGTKEIPVIFLTAKTDDEAIACGFEVGGIDYVTKPFKPVELIARVKTHLRLRDRERELADLNKTKDTILSVISHDLRTPFFNIMSLGELLLKNYKTLEEEEITEILTNMVQASRISHNLLDNLLNWTKVQTDNILFEPEVLNLKEIIEENLHFVSPQAMNKEILCEHEPLKDIQVVADKNMLNTILRNLISNAIKYTPRGGIVTVRTNKKKRKVAVVVEDTGIGMSPEKVRLLMNHTIFNTTPGTEHESGSGFGLVLTNEFVEMNKGEMEIKSTKGKGSTFSFTVPLSPNENKSREN